MIQSIHTWLYYLTRLEVEFDVKQIFPDTARQPQPPAHIKEQTDERISQTIVRIQSNQAKRDFLLDFLFAILTASTPFSARITMAPVFSMKCLAI